MIILRLAAAALLAALVAAPCPAAAPVGPDGLLIPATDTRLKVYGKVWLNGWYYFDQNLGDTGPLVGGDTDALNAAATPDRQSGMTAKYSQVGLRGTTPSARWGDITSVVELDFSKGNAKNGGANLRHAHLTLGRWTLGHTWSNWLDQDAAGTTVDMNGPVGQPCNGSSRFTQVRYTFPAGRRSTFAFSLEQNKMAWEKVPSGLAPDSPARPDARYPSLIGAYTFVDTWGHLGLRALGQHHGAYTPGASAAAPPLRAGHWGGAAQLSGALKLGGDLLAASVYGGQGLGEYGAGFQTLQFNGGTRDFQLYRNTGWQAAYTHAWTDQVHSGLVLGGVDFRDNGTLALKDISHAGSAFVNTFVKLHRDVELGMEYGYEELRTFGRNQVTRRDGSKSDRNHSSKLQVSFTAKF